MTHPARLLLLALAVLPVATAAPRHPEPVRTEWTRTSTATLLSSTTLVDGEPVEVPGRMTRTIEERTRLVFHDAPILLGFVRSFEATERSSRMRMVDPYGGEHASDGSRRSRWHTQQLRFEQDPDDGGWTVRPGDAPDGAPLDGPRPTPDWRSLAAGDRAEVGATWELDASWLEHLREPGGELEWRAADPNTRDDELIAPAGATVYSGRVVAELLERDPASRRDRIGLRVEASATLDLTPFLPPLEDGEHGEGAHRFQIQADTFGIEIEGSGECLFDRAAGRPESLTLDLVLLEEERVDFGHKQLTPFPGTHDVRVESVSESRIAERIEFRLQAADATSSARAEDR